jgi:hypothetical protein
VSASFDERVRPIMAAFTAALRARIAEHVERAVAARRELAQYGYAVGADPSPRPRVVKPPHHQRRRRDRRGRLRAHRGAGRSSS